MTKQTITRASLAEIGRMRQAGELHHDAQAPAQDSLLGSEFWTKAMASSPKEPPKSGHLKLDSEVFDFFKAQGSRLKAQGKGHLTKMQDVLKA